MSNSGVFIVLFDLPTKTKTQIKLANHFRKELKKNGYFMLQESVYIKLFHRISNIEAEKVYIKSIVPNEGTVYTLKMNLSMFKQMETVIGNEFDFNLFSGDVVYV